MGLGCRIITECLHLNAGWMGRRRVGTGPGGPLAAQRTWEELSAKERNSRRSHSSGSARAADTCPRNAALPATGGAEAGGAVVGDRLPPDWQTATDPRTGDTYFWNTVTQEVRWTAPPGNEEISSSASSTTASTALGSQVGEQASSITRKPASDFLANDIARAQHRQREDIPNAALQLRDVSATDSTAADIRAATGTANKTVSGSTGEPSETNKNIDEDHPQQHRSLHSAQQRKIPQMAVRVEFLAAKLQLRYLAQQRQHLIQQEASLAAQAQLRRLAEIEKEIQLRKQQQQERNDPFSDPVANSASATPSEPSKLDVSFATEHVAGVDANEEVRHETYRIMLAVAKWRLRCNDDIASVNGAAPPSSEQTLLSQLETYFVTFPGSTGTNPDVEAQLGVQCPEDFGKWSALVQQASLQTLGGAKADKPSTADVDAALPIPSAALLSLEKLLAIVHLIRLEQLRAKNNLVSDNSCDALDSDDEQPKAKRPRDSKGAPKKRARLASAEVSKVLRYSAWWRLHRGTQGPGIPTQPQHSKSCLPVQLFCDELVQFLKGTGSWKWKPQPDHEKSLPPSSDGRIAAIEDQHAAPSQWGGLARTVILKKPRNKKGKKKKKHPPWRRILDPSTGRHYFFDPISKTTQWEEPDCLREEREEAEAAANTQAAENAQSGDSDLSKPVATAKGTRSHDSTPGTLERMLLPYWFKRPAQVVAPGQALDETVSRVQYENILSEVVAGSPPPGHPDYSPPAATASLRTNNTVGRCVVLTFSQNAVHLKQHFLMPRLHVSLRSRNR